MRSARSIPFDDTPSDEDERAATVLDSLPFDVIHVDRSARIRYANRAAIRTLERIEAFLPVPAQQILGQPIDVLDRLPEVVDLTLSPMVDACGKYIGTVLTTRYHDGPDLVSIGAAKVQEQAGRVASAVGELQTNAAAMVRSTTSARQASQAGVESTEQTERIVTELRDGSDQIGQLVGLVASITRQTSLLALTVGIEATRAAEESPAVGVIANDVKSLARQTAKTSEEIRRRADAVVKNSEAAATALLRFDGIVRELAAHQDEIDGAVGAQNAAAARVASEAAAVARSSAALAESATWVSQGDRRTDEGATDIRATYPRREA